MALLGGGGHLPGLRAGRGREGRVVLPNMKRLQRGKGEERILLAIIHSLNLESSLHYLGLAPLPGVMGGEGRAHLKAQAPTIPGDATAQRAAPC